MQLWLVLALSAVAWIAIAVFAAIRVQFEARAIGEPSGHWVCASGAQLGPLSISGVAGRGTPLALHAHVFGRRIPLVRRRRRAVSDAASAPTAQKPETPRDDERRRIAGFTALDWLELALAERRRIQIERLTVDLGYGFDDIALTGRIAGALYALSGALPHRIVLRQSPRWQGGEKWEISANGAVRAWPGRVLAELLWAMLRARFAARSRRDGARAMAPAATPPPS